MSANATIYQLLQGLVAGRVYPNATPDAPVFPLIVYQAVGGTRYAYVDKARPDHQHARIQIVVWSKSSLEAEQLSDQIEALMVGASSPAEAYGAPVDDYQDALKLYGKRQDFGVWFAA